MPDTNNCHYVSRFLTKPWEGAGRTLHYYDFAADRILRKSSKTLLAADRINSQVVETFLNRMVERNLSLCRDAVARGSRDALQDWRNYRAAVLMLWLQILRTEARDPTTDARARLEKMAAWTSAEVDTYVAVIQQEHVLRVISTETDEQGRHEPLYVPSSGFFAFTFRDQSCLTGRVLAFAVPIDLHCALVAAPRGCGDAEAFAEVGRLLPRYSVTGKHADRVVISALLREAYDDATLRASIREHRESNLAIQAAVAEARAQVVRAVGSVGALVEEDSSKRLRIVR